jgi:hypothetical protein
MTCNIADLTLPNQPFGSGIAEQEFLLPIREFAKEKMKY